MGNRVGARGEAVALESRGVVRVAKVLVVVFGLALLTGCWLDYVFVNRQTRDAVEQAEVAKAEAEAAKKAYATAKTDEEKAKAEARLVAAKEALDTALADLDEALDSDAPSPAEALAAAAGPFVPWLVGVVGAVAGVYKGVRAKRGDKATEAFVEGVEEIGDTDEGKKLKKKLHQKLKAKGADRYVDAFLRTMGVLAKSKS